MKLVLQIAGGILLAAIIIGIWRTAETAVFITALTHEFKSMTATEKMGPYKFPQAREITRPTSQPRIASQKTTQYRRVLIPPKTTKECMGGKNMIDEAVVKCTQGYWITVPVEEEN